MKAIILAAGRGSRMQTETAVKPKCLVTLKGYTLLDMNLKALEQAGFRRKDVAIVTGYCAEKLQVPGLTCFHNPYWAQTNMFYSLTKAAEWLTTEPCLVCYSDIVYHPAAAKRLRDCRYDLAITYYTGFQALWKLRFNDPLSDIESFRIEGDGRISEIGQPVTSMDEVQGQFMGLMRITPRGWQLIQEAIQQPMNKTIEQLDMTTLLNHIITLGHPVYGLASDELWLECDSRDDLMLYEQLL